jgi:ComF family protein
MWRDLLSFCLKFPCPLCQRPADTTICLYCQKQLESCQINNPSSSWQGNLPVFSWGVYDGKLKRAIATCKYDRQPEIGKELGKWLGKSWKSNSIGQKNKNLIVLPIPLAEEKLKTRGFNQAVAIAQGFCQETGYSLSTKGLVRIKDTQPMFNLSPHQRQENIRQAFVIGKSWHKQIPRSPVLLLDDIYTTGTTVKEAAKLLRSKEIKVLGVIVLSSPASSI